MNKRTNVHDRLEDLSTLGWTLIAATAFGLLSVVVAVIVLALFFGVNLLDVTSSNWAAGPPYAVSAWISGTFFGGLAWWLLVEKPTNASNGRGMLAGGAAMLSTHLLMFVIPIVWGIRSGGSPPALSVFPSDPADLVVIRSVGTLLLMFPFSIPAAGLVGRALVRRRRHHVGAKRTIDVRERLDHLSARDWTLLAATAFGIGATIAAVIVPLLFGAPGFGILLAPGAGLGSFAIGGILWWVLVELRRQPSSSIGALVGAMTALLTNFLLPIFDATLLGGATGLFPTLGGDAIGDVVAGGALTLAYGGLITIPTGAYIGWRLALLREPTIEGSGTGGVSDAPTE